MYVVLCEWVKQNGFFHHFDSDLWVISLNKTQACWLLVEGVEVTRVSTDFGNSAFPSVVKHYAETIQKNERSLYKMGICVGVGLIAWLMLILIFVSSLWRFFTK